MLTGRASHPTRRYYLNVYPALDATPLGPATKR